MGDASDLAAACILLAVAIKRKQEKKGKINRRKRIWCREMYKERSKKNEEIIKELEYTEDNNFHTCVRMNKLSFDALLDLVSPLITRRNTLMRDAIPAHHRLALTLRCLVSGMSFEDLKSRTAVAPQTIGKIVHHTCDAIINKLQDFMKLPTARGEWKEEAKDFYNLWGVPNCLGTVNGRHVNIMQPHGTGTLYFNHKRKYSIILLAVVNAKYQFMWVDVGEKGSARDQALFKDKHFFTSLKARGLNLPEPQPLPHSKSHKPLPFIFAAESAFQSTGNMIPCSDDNYMTHNHRNGQEIFNRWLLRAQQVADKTFDILASRFRILTKTMNLAPEKASTIVKACCYLHNFLLTNNDSEYFNGGFEIITDESAEQHDGPTLDALQPSILYNKKPSANDIRDNYCRYIETFRYRTFADRI